MLKWVLPTVTELLARHLPIDLLSLIFAAWILYLQRGVDERGRALQIIDARAAELQAAAREAGLDARPFLGISWIFGSRLSSDTVFTKKVQAALRRLVERGVHETIRTTLAEVLA